MTKRVRRSNVKDGVLLPLGNGFSLVKGDHPNKVDDVDIGPNNKNGLSVNHGEILQQKDNTLRVFSAEPMLGGVSPAQLLYGGMEPDKVFAMQEQYKDIHGINDNGSRQHAQFGLFKKIKERLNRKNKNSNQEYINYFDATNEQKKDLQTKLGKYDIFSVGDYGDTHFGVVEARYKSLTDSMKRKGFTLEEINRLSPFLITQQVLEGGYKLSNDTNNFGGLLVPGTNKKMSFKSIDDFNDYYLSNLDEKWGDNYLGKGRGWRNAKTLKEYADIINREDLKLYSKEAYDEYNRQHKDKPAYIYTPLWENNNTGLMSEPKFGGIYPRVSGMLDLLKTRIEDWNNIAKTNNIVKKEFGGDVDLNSLVNRINTTSNADFIKRLKDPNRKYIRKGNTIYTHLLGYVTDGDRAIVYPEVQSTNKGLKIFKGRQALDRAIENRDTLHMSIPEAEAFTTQYKDYYPGFKFGGQTNINSLGERPNAKYGKQMKNKRNKAVYGRNAGLRYRYLINNLPNFPMQVMGPTIGPRNPFNVSKAISSNPNFEHPIIDKYGATTGVSGNVTSIKVPESQGLKVPTITPKSSGLSAIGADLIGAGINAAGSLIAAGINQSAINNQRFTPRRAVLLNPVKLKTKININPQLGQMRETVAKISDAARRTSASSRNAYQKIADTRLRGLDAIMGLYGDKENKETSLINQDRLNQQNVAAQNAQNVINTVNTNIAGKDALNNNWHMLTAQNWINPVNVIAGTVAGEQGILARRDARRNNAANLAMMSLAYPDAARMIMSGDGWQKAFNGYYDMLNNKVRV